MKKSPSINRGINAREILDLLKARHQEDLFVPECKNGPSQSVKNFLRLDAWVMKKSWTNPCVTGYEIKVSRSDFLQDEKWRGYLPYCNEFYFVAPHGLIDPKELPAEAGLLVASRNCRCLHAKKRSPHREVEIPEQIFRYVLMCRAKIAEDRWNSPKTEWWKAWLAEKNEDKDLGYYVSKAIRDRVTAVEERNASLESRMSGYDGIIKVLHKLGYSERDIERGWIGERSFNDRLERIRAAVPQDLVEQIAEMGRKCATVSENLAKHLNPAGESAPVGGEQKGLNHA